jgi:5-methylcytosine-specific restriction endonuclease McrA
MSETRLGIYYRDETGRAVYVESDRLVAFDSGAKEPAIDKSAAYKRRPFKPSQKLKKLVWQKTGGLCFYCGCKLLPYGSNEPDLFTIDHVAPMRNGGDDNLDNLVPSCSRCNRSKGDKSERKQ